jgi:hypothetical protein
VAEELGTPALTICGSRSNQFAVASGQIGSWLKLAGINLEMPHDTIVEDRSVNLSESILPNEIAHKGAGPYPHLRATKAARTCGTPTSTTIRECSTTC